MTTEYYLKGSTPNLSDAMPEDLEIKGTMTVKTRSELMGEVHLSDGTGTTDVPNPPKLTIDNTSFGQAATHQAVLYIGTEHPTTLMISRMGSWV